MTKEEFIEDHCLWPAKGRKYFESDLDEVLRAEREEGIESGKIIERHGSESYIE